MSTADEQVRDIANRALSKGVVKIGPFTREPDFTLLSEGAGPPRFPVDRMGEAASWLTSAAAGAGVYPDYVASALLSAVSALVGKLYCVDVDQDDWKEPCSVWCFSVGEPSSGKTPAAKAIRRALSSIEMDMRVNHEAEVTERIKAAAAFVERATSKTEQSEAEEKMRELETLKGLPPRIRLNDTTKEALQHVSMRAPRGLMMDADELTGWLQNMAGYSGGSSRPFYLEAWSPGSHQVDRRKEGGTITIKNHLLTVHGGIQPGPFADLLLKSTTDDGLAARALLFWPNARDRKGLRGNRSNHKVMIRALNRLARLESNEDEQATVLDFSETAFDVFEDYYLTTWQVQRKTFNGKLGSAQGKMSAQLARLSGLLHLIDWAFGDGDEPSLEIAESHVHRAIALIDDYFIPQAKRVYHGLDSTYAERMAMEILAKARDQGHKQFSRGTILRDWKLTGYRGRKAGEAEAARDEAINLLISAGWIQQSEANGQVRIYRFNPLLSREPS